MTKKAKKSATRTRRTTRKRDKRRPVTVNLRDLPKESNPNLQLAWVDRMDFAGRGDIPIVTLRFYSAVGGELLHEAARLQMTTQHLKSIADVICRQLSYYPTPSKSSGS